MCLDEGSVQSDNQQHDKRHAAKDQPQLGHADLDLAGQPCLRLFDVEFLNVVHGHLLCFAGSFIDPMTQDMPDESDGSLTARQKPGGS